MNTTTTPQVHYSFADGSDNTIRPLGMVYPNGRELTFDYGGAGSVSDASSRIAVLIDDDTTPLVEYEYLGLSSFVIANNPQPDLQWTLASLTGTDDPDTGDLYAGLDRFGRIKDCRWYNSSEEEDAVRLKYGYDRDSNRLWRQDDIARSLSNDFDELYTYDGLQRLKTMQRGLLNGSHDAISNQTYGQCWNLDATENWTGMKQAEGGTDWTLEQSRTANPVNEITDITNAVGSPWAQPAYDAAGNMTTIPIGNGPCWSPMTADDWSSLSIDGWGAMDVEPPALTATWDAWNRLVRLEDASTSQTVAEYQYDAENRRILKKLYASGSLSETRHIYLSDQNQILEERVDASEDAALQNIWGLQYIDGLILRDRDTNGNGTLDQRRYCLQDANWNTVALTDESGTITQRFCYQPFGTVQFLGANYEAGANDSEWVTLFTGRELDPESGLYYFRARYASSGLGQFLTKDELGYIDGRSSYALYFVPNDIDPDGYQKSNNTITDEQCRLAREAARERDPIIQSLEAEIVNHGCPLPNYSCTDNKNIYSAYFNPYSNELEVSRIMPSDIDINDARKVTRKIAVSLQHELTHALDSCMGMVPPGAASCDQILCAEARAYSCSGECPSAGGRSSCMLRKLTGALTIAQIHGSCPQSRGVIDDRQLIQNIFAKNGCICNLPCEESGFAPPALPPMLING